MRSRAILSSIVALALAGCGGSHGSTDTAVGVGPNGVTTTTVVTVGPIAPAATLTVFAENDTDEVIDVFATTPDETVDLGLVDPGQAISVDLLELPPYVTLSASARTPDTFGVFEAFPAMTFFLGSDYTEASPDVSMAWFPDPSFAVFATTTTAADTVAPSATTFTPIVRSVPPSPQAMRVQGVVTSR
jgi:hypothetical protein